MPPKMPFLRNWAGVFFLLALLVRAHGGDTHQFLLRAEAEFLRAQKVFNAATNDAAARLQFARASFLYADLATNETQRAGIAQTGIAVCRQWLAGDPKSAPAHYYLAATLGELAQAEAPSIAAYLRVYEVEREFKAAAELDLRLDYAGPARTLGELYFQAPGWPLSIGSKDQAREWLERAAALAPEYPENWLNLAEAHLKWREKDGAAQALRQLDAGWAAAQTNFAGPLREGDWLDWTTRRAAARAEFQTRFKTAP
jgi:tetratricopeptide (TPR) repeat protein